MEQENIRNYDLSHREVLKEYMKENMNRLDKLIKDLDEEIYQLIMSNIPYDKINGEIEMPYISTENSEYQKLKHCKNNINQKLKQIDDRLSFKNLLTAEDIYDLEAQQCQLKSDLETIKSNPKRYLRMNEARCYDYSAIDDETIRIIIQNKIRELSLYKREKVELGAQYAGKFKRRNKLKPKQKEKKLEKK